MRLRIAVCLLAGLTACSGSSAPTTAATGASSPSASPTAAASVEPSSAPPSPSIVSSPSPGAKPLVIAVADKKGGLALYAVPPGEHEAGLLRRFAAPAKKVVVAVSLSAGAAPTVCAIWRAEPPNGTPNELDCFAPSFSYGPVVSKKAAYGVSVRADGRALAWTENQNNQDLVVGDLNEDHVQERSRLRYAPDAPVGGIPEGISDVDWLTPRRIAVNDVGDSDEGKGLCLVDLDKPRSKTQTGFAPCVKPGPGEQRAGYDYFEQLARVSDTEAIVVERAHDCCGDDDPHRPGGRAVRIRLSDGAVLAVLASPRAGRDVVDVSGSDRALLYTTAVNFHEQLVVSLRWAGELRGSPLTGLPADLILATAQS